VARVLPDATQRALHAAAARVNHLTHPSDADIRQALFDKVARDAPQPVG